MSSEKRRIAPNALERDVPPVRTKMAASFRCRPKSRFKVQQTQKSFSMIVSTTPRPSPVAPKRAARSVAGRRATLSIEIAQRCVGDGDDRTVTRRVGKEFVWTDRSGGSRQNIKNKTNK